MTSSGRPLTGLSVLIAEDSWQLAHAMRKTVELAGARVVGMASALEDVEDMARTMTYDALVLDLNLQGQRAHILAEELAGAGRKVVVLTGYERPEGTKVFAWLTKPVSTDDIIGALAPPQAG